MKTVTEFPREVQAREEGMWIPMSDGVRLAARIWLPADAERDPVPALLEYLPYRKRDMTRRRDEPLHHYFAGHGYASVRVDLRGAGDSFGVMHDEYAKQEQDDAVEVIAWLAEQPWCTGAVGMFGISWGGFNSLQVAARRPPALKAIITSCSTDDRYTDDMHYAGGCLLNDNSDWGTTFFSILPLPGDPQVMGEGWRENWRQRLESAPCPIETWLRHQCRDEYWKHGSVNEDYEAIQCAVFAVGGWLDGYSSAIPRLLSNLEVPRLGLIGPHAHQFGHSERPPGPAIGFLQECLRWWDHWLKGRDTGIMEEPMLRAYMGEDIPAAPHYEHCPGRWVAEATWPSPRSENRTLHLNRTGLESEAGAEHPLSHCSPQSVGLAAGEWCPYGTGGEGAEFPGDQRVDDARSLVFDGPVLDAPLEILGAPEAALAFSVDRPLAFVCVRLNDVKPDGSVNRVTYGLLNLTHREGHAAASPLVPGQRYEVRVPLNDIAYSLRAGHRVRVSISTTYWPMVWPSPEPVTLTLFTGTSTLNLPVRPREGEPACAPFEEPEEGPSMPYRQVEEPSSRNRAIHDMNARHIEVCSERGDGLFEIEEHGIAFGRNTVERMVIREDDPLSAETEMRLTCTMAREEWCVEVDARTRVTASRDAFELRADLDVHENGARVHCRTWNLSIPRDGV